MSYRNQSIDLQSKSIDWFLYDIDLRHERVNLFQHNVPFLYSLKMSEHQRSSGIFRRCRNGTLGINGLMNQKIRQKSNAFVSNFEKAYTAFNLVYTNLPGS